MAAPSLQSGVESFLDELRLVTATAPDAIALVEPGGARQSYEALQRRAKTVAHAVASAGIARDDVVAVILPDGAELMVSFLGVASVVGCAVVNPALRDRELEQVLAAVGARAVIVDPALGLAADVARANGMAVLSAEPDDVGGTPCDPPRSSHVALLLHTSATTGKARIVSLTHSNVQAMAANTRGILGLTCADRFLSMMPMFHLQGLLSALAQLLAGGSVICTAGFDAGAFLGWMEEYRPTWYTAGPTLHHAILPLVEAHPEVLERAPLRFVRSIGAALPHALMEQLERTLRAPVLEGYGTTEAGAISSNTPRHRRPGSAGRTTGSEIGIMNEQGEILPADQEGEIVVRGRAVMKGYRNDAEADRNAFRDGWFRTGDLGRLDPEGFLFVTGRIKEIINRGGEKILPGEVEDALLAHPAVAEAVAFGIPHATLGEDVMAAVILRAGALAGELELRRFAAERIADFKLPRRIIFLSEIPKGATGKASRAALPAQLASEIEATNNASAALSEIENRLAEIWRRILKVERVDLRDDFFQLGGDSLAFMLTLAEAGLDLGPEDRAEFRVSPTIETLARVAARSPGPAAERSWVVTAQPRGTRIPFFCIPGADENPYYFLDLAQALGQEQPFFIVRDPRPPGDRGVYTLEEHAALFREAIRSMWARGPYILGGHCYGGIVAFEVARQLMAQGEEVGLVALFEVPTPGYPKLARHWKRYLKQCAVLGASALRGEASEVVNQARAHFAALRQLFERKKQAATRRALVSAGMQSWVDEAEHLDFRNTRAGRAYVPGGLACKVVHFLAADVRHSTQILDDPRLGWRDAVGSGFSSCNVPGVANAIFHPPFVAELALRLRAELDKVNARAEEGG